MGRADQFSRRRNNARGDGYTDSNSVRNPNPNTYSTTRRNGNPDADTNFNPNSHTYANAHADTDSNPYTDTDAYTDADSDRHANTDPRADPHANPHTASHSDTDSDPHTDPDAYPDTDSHPWWPDAHAHGNPNPHTDAHAHTNADPDANSWGPAHRHIDLSHLRANGGRDSGYRPRHGISLGGNRLSGRYVLSFNPRSFAYGDCLHDDSFGSSHRHPNGGCGGDEP